jgi:hypothetical protein
LPGRARIVLQAAVVASAVAETAVPVAMAATANADAITKSQ